MFDINLTFELLSSRDGISRDAYDILISGASPGVKKLINKSVDSVDDRFFFTNTVGPSLKIEVIAMTYGFSVESDNDGQLILYTGVNENEDP